VVAKKSGTPPRQKRATPKSTTTAKKVQYSSVGSSWGKVQGAAPWVGGQSSGLTPGSEQAISRRKHSSKFKSRGKKVIRPRITKHVKQADK
jgi:hypothetical protein